MEAEEEVEIYANVSDKSEASSDHSVSESEQSIDTTDSYLLIPCGLQSKGCYKPKSKSKEITGVTYNSRTRQFIILDSKGVTAWSSDSVVKSVSPVLDYPSYQFNVIRLLLHSKKFNVYFALTKDYALKVFNLNFHEVFSVVSDMNSILSMVFNFVTDELITGGTGGVKFWSFGEIKTKDNSLIKDSRPMANYGLILRYEHPAMGRSWVKDIVLDEINQKLYCLSERNVIAYDMQGNILFQLKSAHQGFVTGCVYSKFSNFVVTGGTDCLVDVFSSNGGCIHSFSSHSKMVTSVLLHPDAPSLVITSSQDGTVKIFSLDIMEEIYSHMVFAEGIQWMNLVSSDLLYCASSKGLQVFSINHISNFWTTIRCPLKSLSLSVCCGKTQRVVATAEDNSARLLSRSSNLLSTVLPPPSITTLDKQFVRAYAYSLLYGLMYLLVDDKEIWVYYTKTNPANRVEVWQLSDIQDVIGQRTQCYYPARTKSCTPTAETSRPSTGYQRPPTSLYPCSKIVDGVSCLALALLDSHIILNTDEGESCPVVSHFLVAGLQDGRLLFLNPFSASLMYLEFQTTKGAVLSIHHDVANNSLLLSTIALNQFTIQIRSLPYLELEYQVNVGNDLNCFVRMDNTILSGHETGRLKLHHTSTLQINNTEQLISHDEARKYSAKKLSKDHLDTVLSVDGNSDLQLFCSSSKDGCIKIWDNGKLLLREIIMDSSLTAVCFLNSSGDLLAGFKNHIFSISHEKVHLSFYNKNANIGNDTGAFETESDVYEDPKVRFEFKKTSPPELIRMETYLVPFADMSINLGRYLSDHPPPSAFENDVTSKENETDSEISDLFSVAPTEMYMSKTGTPLTGSRCSSPVGSWDLPNLGSSPVPSPPRTPPLVMMPLLESESESEEREATTSDDLVVPKESNEVLRPVLNWKPPAKEERKQSTKSAMPVITRQKRTGLSQVKINSRAIRSKTSIHSDKSGEDEKISSSGGHEVDTRGGHEGTTKLNIDIQEPIRSNRVRRSPRAVIKKTKKSVVKSTRSSVKNQGTMGQSELLNTDLASLNEKQGIVKTTKKDVQGAASGNENVESMVEETSATSVNKNDVQENTRGNSAGNTRVSLELHAMRPRQEEGNEKVKDVPEQLRKMNRDEVLIEPVANNSLVDELPSTTPFTSLPSNTDEQKKIFSNNVVENNKIEHVFHAESEGTKQQLGKETTSSQLRHASPSTIPPPKVAAISIRHSPEPCHPDSDDSDISKEDLSEEGASSSCDTNTQSETDERQKGPVSKTVSFKVSDEDEKNVCLKDVPLVIPSFSNRITHKSGRHSVSPVNSSSKVVSMSDSRYTDGKSGHEPHPSSALKIYALARMRRESSLVSRPHSERRRHVRRHTGQESLGSDYVGAVTGEDLNRIIGTSKDVEETLLTKTGQEKTRKPVQGKKDLVNWCIDAFREKGNYSVFTPRPRLRSRRSMKSEKNEGKTAALNFRVNTKDDEYGDGEYGQVHGNDFDNRKRETAFEKTENQDWCGRKSVLKCFSPSELLPVNKTRSKELCRSASSIGVYKEGWQDRVLEKATALREKRSERERNVSERRRADMDVLEEKRRSVLGQREPMATKQDIEERFAVLSLRISQQEEESKERKSSFENLKNNPQIFQPYRLRKFDSCNDERHSWISALKVDRETQCAADGIFDLLPRPKSAPSIPSKCRKYMLVASQSEDIRNEPVLTPLEETLMFKRFPKSKLKPRTPSSTGSAQRRPYTVAKINSLPISCE